MFGKDDIFFLQYNYLLVKKFSQRTKKFSFGGKFTVWTKNVTLNHEEVQP